MNQQPIALHIPENVFQRLQRMAQAIHQPLEAVVCQSIQGNLPPLVEDAPEEWRGDLTDLEQLNDEDLLKVGKEPFPNLQ